MEPRYWVRDIYGNSWKITMKEFDELEKDGYALKICKDNGVVYRTKYWLELQDTRCPYLD